MHPFVALMRRYVVDYLICQDMEVCAQIMVPDYVLHMGGVDLGPRDDVYVPAVARQLQQFPGLGMTVHEIVLSNDRLALRFSQHGASVKHSGARAAWSGIGLYKWDGERLTSNYAIEDYASRRTQLATGHPLTVDSPAIAPWDQAPHDPQPAHETLVRNWLQNADWATSSGLVVDDSRSAGQQARSLLDVTSSRIDDLFSAGDAVGFHITETGRYRGGLELPDSCVGRVATLFSVGLVHLDANGALTGHVLRERATLQRELTR